jgi:cysteine desulfurase family protein
MIYLDNAATTYPKPENVYDAMDDANRNLSFNAGRGSYRKAKEATALIDDTKKLLLNLVNAPAGSTVAFTPSITIALNEILQGISLNCGDNIYVSPYEHNAVARVCELISEKKNINIIKLPVKEDTFEIDLDKVKVIFAKERPSLVCCLHVSNVTGYILPIKELFELAKQYTAVTVLDTAQSLGLVKLDLSEVQADYVGFAGHKSLYGPFGIGGIISTSSKLKLNVVIAGGTGSNSLNLEMPQNAPGRYEYASSNIVAIAGLKAALTLIDVEEKNSYERKLTNKVVESLEDIPNVIVYAPPREKHIGVISFNVNGYQAEDIGMILDEDYDIAVRTGYHCAPWIHELLGDEKFSGTVRVGLSSFSTEKDIEELVDAIMSLN